ncbi:MAG: hypothetical protein ACTH6Y_07015 [Vibrio hibernica]
MDKLKSKLNGISEQQDFSYLALLPDAALKTLTTDGESKAEKYEAQQELLRRALGS